MRAILTTAAFAMATVLAGPAVAATEEECKSAIAELQDELSSNAAYESRPEEFTDRIDNVLAQAGYEGVEGRHEQCLEMVDRARAEAGLRKR